MPCIGGVHVCISEGYINSQTSFVSTHLLLCTQVIMDILNGNNPGAFVIGDVKYMVLGSEDPENKLRGKCKGGGCSISKTATALVIGIWAEPIPPATCNKIVEALAEYLVGVSY